MRKHDKISRLGAMFLALAMVITMCLPGMAMAADDGKKTGTITVNNLDAGAEVKIYKIVKANYNKDNKVTGFEAVTEEIKSLFTVDGKVDFNKAPDATKASALAAAAEKLEAEKGVPAAQGETLTVMGREPGLYYVKVTSANAVVYNPIIVGVNINDNNEIRNSEINLDGAKWAPEAFAKKSEPKVVKEITTNAVEGKNKVSDTETKHEGEKTEDAQTIGFKISADVPSYATNYLNVELVLKDTLSEGLKLDQKSIAVKCGKDDVKATVDEKTDNGFKVTINNIDWIRKHANQKVVVTYNAVLKSDAPKNFDASTNTVTYEFTNDPSDKANHGETTDKTYHYTFSLDGAINGAGSWITKELIKTGEEKITGEGITENEPLKGAKFSLTNTKTGYKQEIETDENGLMNFTGLDGNTEYELVETKAPQGYFTDKTVRTIKVVPTYDEQGRLTKYHVEITKDGEETTKSPEYTASYDEKDEITEIKVNDTDVLKVDNEGTVDETILNEGDAHEIKNSKQAELPTTGGMGTYVFTILGVAVIAIAGGLYMKKKNN